MPAGPNKAKCVAPAWLLVGPGSVGDLMYWFQCLSLIGLDGLCGLKGACPGLAYARPLRLSSQIHRLSVKRKLISCRSGGCKVIIKVRAD